MKSTNFLCGILGSAAYFFQATLAQDFAYHGMYTEPNTGITFYTSYETNGTVVGDGEFSQVSLGGYTFGMALPGNALTVNSYDYIGLIIGSTPTGSGGWTGQVHGDDGGAFMPNRLMLLAWPTGNGDEIATSFRFSTAYEAPRIYAGTASVTQFYSHVNATHYVLVYKCTRCLIFDDPSQTGYNASTSLGQLKQGWAQSFVPATDPTNANSEIQQHNNGMGVFMVPVQSATQASYSMWATMTATVSQVSGTSTPTVSVSSRPVPTGTYDYVIIGGGAGGIPMADRLSATGKKVLLIEKGIASSARWGGTVRPESHWMDGTNLTWFDVPGECNRIWNGGAVDSATCKDCGAACHDTDQMAGCVLGGGTAVNAGLWWRPNPVDWDVNFPTGWKSTDMAAPAARVFSRIPGTDHPSSDGQIYLKSGYNIIGKGLNNAKWTNITANALPGSKNRTFAYTAYMYSHGERGGPMATYLVNAAARPNFKMWLNTSVERIVRTNGHATGLDVQAYRGGGYSGRVQLTPVTGRVIVAAGTFGTAKLLFRSGIGPTDQLQIVQSSTDGPLMINSSQWINAPVGYNLDDHLNTDTVISHPNISYYDWPAAWNTPIAADKAAYLSKRAGPLSQAAPNIGPMMWEEVKGPDGIVRQFQWTSRVEGSNGAANGNTMTLSLYLGRGSISRGRTVIQKGLNMVVDTLPYGNVNDLATVAIAIDHMAKALLTVPGLTYLYGPYATGENPQCPANLTAAQFVAQVPLTFGNLGARRSNHWLGSAKMGPDAGILGGTAVVDRNTKVYGTDNIFVVDASIFPGMPSTNPSSYVVTVAERAADLITALPANAPVALYGQCGGLQYGGSQVCAAPSTCKYSSAYYSQCLS